MFIPMFLCSLSYKATITLMIFDGAEARKDYWDNIWISSLLQFAYVVSIDYVTIGWCLVLEGFKFKYAYTFIPVYLLLTVYWILALLISFAALKEIHLANKMITNYYDQ
eukprot:TRINITY_DN2016_c0_g1_i6.p2 TRINITY_DN2016_c0_g1~~TRINITY_DN2016_c0_g1_i6.p2  ORF type:complete len:109 (+),score=14.61 TRINITY_DN2016_c0_g1_i6:403-729(+)